MEVYNFLKILVLHDLICESRILTLNVFLRKGVYN